MAESEHNDNGGLGSGTRVRAEHRAAPATAAAAGERAGRSRDHQRRARAAAVAGEHPPSRVRADRRGARHDRPGRSRPRPHPDCRQLPHAAGRGRRRDAARCGPGGCGARARYSGGARAVRRPGLSDPARLRRPLRHRDAHRVARAHDRLPRRGRPAPARRPGGRDARPVRAAGRDRHRECVALPGRAPAGRPDGARRAGRAAGHCRPPPRGAAAARRRCHPRAARLPQPRHPADRPRAARSSWC